MAPPPLEPTVPYEEPVKPWKQLDSAPLLPPGEGGPEVVEMENGNVPYVPPPNFDWEPGKEYVVGQPVDVEQLYFPQGHNNNQVPQGVAFKQ